MSGTEEKVGFFKKAWKYVVTGVTCAVVGGGVMVGADVAKIQETITKAQAKNAIIAAAQYSAEQVLSKVTVLSTEKSKLEAIKAVITEVENATPKFIEAAKTVKEAVADVKKDVKETKEAIKEAKEETNKKDATVTNAKEEVKKADATVKAEAKKTDTTEKKEVKKADATAKAETTEVKK